MSAYKVGLVLDLGCWHQIIWKGRGGGVVAVPLSACLASSPSPRSTEARTAQSV